jgi:hypothetical protein
MIKLYVRISHQSKLSAIGGYTAVRHRNLTLDPQGIPLDKPVRRQIQAGRIRFIPVLCLCRNGICSNVLAQKSGFCLEQMTLP